MEHVTTIPKRIALSYGYAKRHGALLATQTESACEVFIKSDTAWTVLVELQRHLGTRCQFIELSVQEFDRKLGLTYQSGIGDAKGMAQDIGDDPGLLSLAENLPVTEDLLEQEGDAPIIRLINALLSEAIKSNASDIHIESFEKKLAVRFRIDGLLKEIVQPKKQLAPLLISRIKVMAGLDIAEKRLPQDGRISLLLAGRELDIRVSTLPSISGERIVLRLLDRTASQLELSNLGMNAETCNTLKELLHQPHGILLVTGPTGSGKTTTLYAGITLLNDEIRNILTIEDPIEYNLEGIGQTQVNLKTDLTFARGLRAILRQDPDVIMIGEIRDVETADIAVQASLTGHLVLSTLHTNTAIGAIARLIDMGIEPFLLSSSLIGVLAQRLVRVLCSQCRQARPASRTEAELLGIDAGAHVYTPTGCAACGNQGYQGRTGIYELIAVDTKLRDMIHERAPEQLMTDYVRTCSPGIRQDGIDKILAGITSIEEVLRVTREE